MIYLSAQPDDFYFTWQLELQLFNFKQNGISANNIHVLIGYNAKTGLRHYFQDLIDRNKGMACFYTYPDNRRKSCYISSIRPHIIQQHFTSNPWLQHESLFYHDSDIVFRELPDFEKLLMGEIWYVSDTGYYLNSQYIKRAAGEKIFNEMCDVIGIIPEKVIASDQNCGGAQYLLKKTSSEFWEKVENDSEAIFKLLDEDNVSKANTLLKREKKASSYHGIQSWCADMWALLWNAWYFNKDVKVDAELDFCWATSRIEEWHNKKILHYTGTVQKGETRYFRKTNYLQYLPYYDKELKEVDNGSCSYPLTQIINSLVKEQSNRRVDLRDVSFLIPARIDSESRLENLLMVTHYLDKFFDTRILIAERDAESKIDIKQLPSCCRHFFEVDTAVLMHRTKINNFLIHQATTPMIAIYDTDAIFPIEQIIETVQLIRQSNADMVSPYNGDFVSVDKLFKAMFGKLLEPKLLEENKNKHITAVKRSWGGSAFFLRDAYLQAGMDNEHFTSWGPEDLERPKRMKNLGFKVKRVNGPLFHLPHERKENSAYASETLYYGFMEEYLKICNMRKADLEKYILDWPWTKQNIA